MPYLLKLFKSMYLLLFINFPIVFSVLRESLKLEFENNFLVNLLCFPSSVISVISVSSVIACDFFI
jgi:hypothetical protein